MPNRAAEELQNLIAASEDSAQAADNVQSLQDTRNPLDVIPSGEASFGFAEGLATSVIGSFIFGPVGGILLGVAQGILGKEAEQNALDRFAAENEIMGDVNGAIDSQMNRLAAQATNPDDVAQLDAMQTQKDAAIRMMTSASPRLQEEGAALLSTFYDDMTAYTDTQETQRIEAEAFDAELQRQLSQESYDRFNGIKQRFDDESAQYEDIIGASNTAVEALQNGSPTDLMAAAILVNKALDPTSVVRPEEAEAIGRVGNLATQFFGIVEKTVGTGQPILPAQRNELIDLLGTIQGNAQNIQIAREARYVTELNDAEVPTRYWDNFKMVESVPLNAPTRVPDNGDTTGEELADAVTAPVTDAIESTAGFFSEEAANQRTIRNQERMLTSPGLWQPGGLWGRDFTAEEIQQRDEILRRRQRPTN